MVDEAIDLWTSTDKYYHLIFSFTLTLLFNHLLSLTRHHFLRRYATVIAASLSLLAGAAKEFADHLRFFHSSGASSKDAAADFAGVLFASLIVYVFRLFHRKIKSDEYLVGVELV